MTGTLINVASIVVGSALGLLIGARLPERLRSTLMAGMGLFTLGLGLQQFVKTAIPILVLVSVVLGTLLGEAARLEDRLQGLGAWLEARLTRDSEGASSRFVQGFLTASLLYCVGPMAILGSIQDGLTGDFRLLATKGVMDGIASLTLASTLGAGVLLSALPVFVYQGALTLLAGWAQAVLTPAMIAELTATGGVMMIGIGLNLLEVRRVRVGNMLPALVVAPLLVWLIALFGFAI
ncbi:MAG: hypothetical protein A2Z30_04935 [Chloroflexi bacterium RBG_16_64_43]|nr:MAG: hypothetical protein A2Z30_04935 [Chloroflexi bacterium RBG_16_64_43]